MKKEELLQTDVDLIKKLAESLEKKIFLHLIVYLEN